MAQSGYLTNIASEFYVVSILSRLGLDASITLGNKKQVDITVVISEGVAITIDVKAVAGKMDWLLGNSSLHEARCHFVVLVGYEGKFSDATVLPRVWVVPSRNLAEHVSVASNGKTRFLSRRAFLLNGAQYENAWPMLRAT